MDDAWWLFLVGAGAALAVLAKQGILKWIYENFFKRLLLWPIGRRKHDCGHSSESYATDPRTGRTECPRCYRIRIDPSRR